MCLRSLSIPCLMVSTGVSGALLRRLLGRALNSLGALLVKLWCSRVAARDGCDDCTGGVDKTFPRLNAHLYDNPGFGTLPWIILKM